MSFGRLVTTPASTKISMGEPDGLKKILGAGGPSGV